MSTVPYPPQRQLSVGEVLDLSFQIYRTTFVRCLLFATCGVIAGQLAAALRRTPALVALVILIALGCLALFVPVFVTGGALRVLLVLAALVVLCYGLVALSSAMTVLLVEEAGPVASVTRS